MTFGATPSDWDALVHHTADLLPVVSNPHARISAASTIKALGKTPSVYNARGEAAGLLKWTQSTTTAPQIALWSKQDDYGICIQTRAVRAFDIDIDDPGVAQAVVDAIGLDLPTRSRSNSSKRLLAFTMPGAFAKRVIRTAHGAIEFLANGQQFVAVGTHPSGVPYQWNRPFDFPAVDAAAFEDIWLKLEMLFGTGGSVGRVPKATGADVPADDPVADWLDTQGLILGHTPRGLLVACPWEREHTSGETGDSSTLWLPAGSRGEPHGNFRCLHAHCEHRTRGDYLAAVGYAEDVSGLFPVVEDETPLPAFAREKNGTIKALIGNVTAALGHRGMAGLVLGFDSFRDEIMHGPGGADGWQPFTDVDYVKLRIRLEAKGFAPIGRELIRDAVDLVARGAPFDSAHAWLERLVPAWDGTARVASFLRDWWGAEDTAYTRAVASYLWTALAGRVLEPGCKADMVPIFVGPQGCGKSTGVARMAPTHEVFAEISLHDKEDDLSRRLKGRLVVELGELRGLHTRELEAIKAWITRRVENWVPKYREFATTYPRRCLFFGTTNQDQFLADSTGNRRWLPVKVGQVGDFSGVLLQLWAEAREMFREGGVDWRAERLAAEAHEEHTMADPLEAAVRRWLETPDDIAGGAPGARDWVSVAEVCEGVGIDARKPSARGDQMRIGEILRVRLGYERKQQRVNNERVWAYWRKSPPVTTSTGQGRDG